MGLREARERNRLKRSQRDTNRLTRNKRERNVLILLVVKDGATVSRTRDLYRCT